MYIIKINEHLLKLFQMDRFLSVAKLVTLMGDPLKSLAL